MVQECRTFKRIPIKDFKNIVSAAKHICSSSNVCFMQTTSQWLALNNIWRVHQTGERGGEHCSQGNFHFTLEQTIRSEVKPLKSTAGSVTVLLVASLLVWKSVWCVESNYGTGLSPSLLLMLASSSHFCQTNHHQCTQCSTILSLLLWCTPQVTPENP